MVPLADRFHGFHSRRCCSVVDRYKIPFSCFGRVVLLDLAFCVPGSNPSGLSLPRARARAGSRVLGFSASRLLGFLDARGAALFFAASAAGGSFIVDLSRGGCCSSASSFGQQRPAPAPPTAVLFKSLVLAQHFIIILHVVRKY